MMNKHKMKNKNPEYENGCLSLQNGFLKGIRKEQSVQD